MLKIHKITILAITCLCFTTSCTKAKPGTLIKPPRFCEIPDLKNPEPEPKQSPDAGNAEEIKRLKDLLLKSE